MLLPPPNLDSPYRVVEALLQAPKRPSLIRSGRAAADCEAFIALGAVAGGDSAPHYGIDSGAARDYPQSMDKPELLRAIREAHQRVAGALEHVPDQRLLEPVMDDWTGKDLLAHMAWWHDHSILVVAGLREGREPYDGKDPANATDAVNERTHREHLGDPPELTRRAFNESFTRLLAALETVTEEELFAEDRWPWLGGEALVETILWDTSRHYDGHREHLEPLGD